MAYYMDDEFKKFISYEEDLRRRRVFEILYYCGLCKGKLKGLLGNIFILIKKYYLLINK